MSQKSLISVENEKFEKEECKTPITHDKSEFTDD
jgi:hypothetical protein